MYFSGCSGIEVNLNTGLGSGVNVVEICFTGTQEDPSGECYEWDMEYTMLDNFEGDAEDPLDFLGLPSPDANGHDAVLLEGLAIGDISCFQGENEQGEVIEVEAKLVETGVSGDWAGTAPWTSGTTGYLFSGIGLRFTWGYFSGLFDTSRPNNTPSGWTSGCLICEGRCAEEVCPAYFTTVSSTGYTGHGGYEGDTYKPSGCDAGFLFTGDGVETSLRQATTGETNELSWGDSTLSGKEISVVSVKSTAFTSISITGGAGPGAGGSTYCPGTSNPGLLLSGAVTLRKATAVEKANLHNDVCELSGRDISLITIEGGGGGADVTGTCGVESTEEDDLVTLSGNLTGMALCAGYQLKTITLCEDGELTSGQILFKPL